MGATVPEVAPLPAALVRRVQRHAQSERLFRRTARVLVGVSGGQDSVALLLMLRELRPVFGFELVAAHFDHQLRAGSDGDREWVRELCERLGLRCITAEGDVRSAARQRGQGIEAAARAMRYEFLGFAAGREHADCVVTGHTADDQAETVLLRVIRGTGIRGIRGMLPVGQVPGYPAIRLVRPLLVLGRAETAALCRGAGIEPLDDPSNAELWPARNRARLELIPVLRGANPSVTDALVALASHAREVFRGVEQQADGLVPLERGPFGSVFEREAFARLVTEARALVIEREAAFWKLGVSVNRTRNENLQSVVAARTGEVHFGETVVEVSGGAVRIGPRLAPVAAERTVLNVPGLTLVGPYRIKVVTEPEDDEPGIHKVVLPLETEGVLTARPLAPGDHIPAGGSAPARSLPRWARRRLVVVCDRRGPLALVGP